MEKMIYAIIENRLIKNEGWDLFGFMGSRVIGVFDTIDESKTFAKKYIKEHYGLTARIKVQDEDEVPYFDAEIKPSPKRLIQFIAQPLKTKI